MMHESVLLQRRLLSEAKFFELRKTQAAISSICSRRSLRSFSRKMVPSR